LRRRGDPISKELIYTLDWTLSHQAFLKLVRTLIHQAEKKHKVLALPMEIEKGQFFIDQLTVLLAQIDCHGCDAHCCRSNPEGKLTQLVPSEYERLSKKYGKENFVLKNGQAFIPMPCPFLRNRVSSNNQGYCSIYPDRPMICVLYPFQFGGTGVKGEVVLSLASSCPPACKLARNIYMSAWQIRHQFRRLGDKEFWKGFNLVDGS
jgi:Fe-S-cluster containining protein